MAYKTVIIGLGVIARYHVMALKQVERFHLCGVCDLRPDASADALWSDMPFYTCHEALLDALRPDVAIIATPPASHYAIACDCIARGVLPIVEKPLSSDGQEGALFFADELRGRYVPVCHTLYGPEMLWLTEHLPLCKIESVRMTLNDPYADTGGCIAERFISLGGSWLDSAPNALAPLLRIVPRLDDVCVRHKRDERNGLPYASMLTAHHNETRVFIDIAWQLGINHKQTEIEADGMHIVIDHSAQAVYVNDECVFAGEGDRLTQQYANFYRLYPERVPTQVTTQYMYNIIYSNM